MKGLPAYPRQKKKTTNHQICLTFNKIGLQENLLIR